MAELAQPSPESSGIRLDRRLTMRFPLQQEIRYQLVRSGFLVPPRVGRTLDVSSRGILFTTSEKLPVGRSVEVAMHWPAPLNGHCPLQFVASGYVLRSDGKTAAIRIQRYDFRTRSATAGVAGAVRA